MSPFDHKTVRELAQIQVKPSRGGREDFRPFEDEHAFSRALKRAEKAYHKSLDRQCFLDQCLQLQPVFLEQRQFSRQYDRIVRAWKDMSDLGKSDIAATADYFLAIKEHGDDESALANRVLNSPLALVTYFEDILTAIQKAAHINGRATFQVGPSKKKDRLNNKSMAPLREFSYQLKLHWDNTMRSTAGSDFNKKFAFSIAHELVFRAICKLTSKYNKLEVTRIIKSLQAKDYDPKAFREPLPRGVETLKILRPQLVHQARTKADN